MAHPRAFITTTPSWMKENLTTLRLSFVWLRKNLFWILVVKQWHCYFSSNDGNALYTHFRFWSDDRERKTHFWAVYCCITYTVNYQCSFKASFHLTSKMDDPKMHKCSQIICIISFVEIVYEKVHNYLKVFCPYGEWNIFYSVSSFQNVWNVGGENGLKNVQKSQFYFSCLAYQAGFHFIQDFILKTI